MTDRDGAAPPPPGNLQGLLRLAIQNTASAQDDGDSRPAPMDPERRQWLSEALSSGGVNVVEAMRKSLRVLQVGGTEEEEVANRERALNEIMDIVGNIDFANDFQKIGGFSVLVPGLQDSHASIRQLTAELVAELVQNNPYCQQAAADTQLIPVLLKVLDSDEDQQVRIKALYALSCLLRSNPIGQRSFVGHDGFSFLLRAMQSDVEKLKVKASFLLASLCSQQPAFRDEVCNMGFVEQLVALVQREDGASCEHVLSALLALADSHAASLGECQRPELQLRETLLHRLELLQGKEESQEEVEYCQQLLKVCFGDTNEDEKMVAR